MVVMVVLFTLAEMVFIPTVDVVLLKLVERRHRAIGYSLLAISIAAGESLGAGFGVTLHAYFAGRGQPGLLWLAIGAMALLFIAATWFIGRPGSSLAGAPAAEATQS